MALHTTKYPNNIRVVSGLGVTIDPNDVFIEVDTSVGPCTITLETIPASNWEVVYKLYIYDRNNNASVNNITIQAQPGQTINQLGSILIDQNGAGVVIKVLGVDRYVGNFSYAGVVPAGTDELVKVTGADTTAAYLAFKAIGGTGITTQVLNPGGNEGLQFNYSGHIETLTFAQLQVLVAGSSVQAGMIYHIVDAGFTDLGVFVLGLTNTLVSSNGHGYFLNNDYQNTHGNYSGVWFAAMGGLVAGTSMVAWNGEMYESVTGIAGVAGPNADPGNWLLKARGTDPGEYVQEIDVVTYDQVNNLITRREDRRENIIEQGVSAAAVNSLANISFQWGNNLTFGNKCLSFSYISCSNNRGIFTNNLVDTNSVFTAIANVGTIQNNSCVNGSSLSADTLPLGASILRNSLIDNGRLQATSFTSACIENSISGDSEINISAASGLITGNTLADQSEIQAATSAALSIQLNRLSAVSIINTQTATGGTIASNVLEQTSSINANSLQASGNITMNHLTINSLINATNTRGAITNNGLKDTCTIENNFGGANSDIDHNLLFQESTIETSNNNNQVKNNRLENSLINAATNLGNIIENKLVNDCTISCATMTIDGSIDTNYLFNGCTITATNNSATIDKNMIHNDCIIDGTTNSGSVDNNTLYNDCQIEATTNSGTITNNVLENDSTLVAPNNTSTIDTNRILNDSILKLDNNTAIVTDNQLTNDSEINGTNNTGTIWHNICSDGGKIFGNANAGVIGQFGDDTGGNIVRQKSELDVRNQTAVASCGGNQLYDLSFLTFQGNDEIIKKNTLFTAGIVGTTNTEPINFNFVKALNIQLGANATQQLRFTAMAGANNWPVTLDMNNPAIFAAGVLTISFTNDEFGIIKLINASGKTITQIQNVNVAFNTTIINTDVIVPPVRISVVAQAAAASTGQVVGAIGAGLITLQGYVNTNDSVIMKRNGIFCQIIGTPDILT